MVKQGKNISQSIYEGSALSLWMKSVCCWLGEAIYDVIVQEGMIVVPFFVSFLFVFKQSLGFEDGYSIFCLFFTYAFWL